MLLLSTEEKKSRNIQNHQRKSKRKKKRERKRKSERERERIEWKYFLKSNIKITSKLKQEEPSDIRMKSIIYKVRKLNKCQPRKNSISSIKILF